MSNEWPKRYKDLEYSDYQDDTDTLKTLIMDLEDEIKKLEKKNKELKKKIRRLNGQ